MDAGPSSRRRLPEFSSGEARADGEPGLTECAYTLPGAVEGSPRVEIAVVVDDVALTGFQEESTLVRSDRLVQVRKEPLDQRAELSELVTSKAERGPAGEGGEDL